MVEFRNVTKNYGPARMPQTAALRDFSLTLTEGGIYCLLGRNGAGKTTLLKSLAGHIGVSSGVVAVNGREVNTLNMSEDVYFVENNAPQFNMKLTDLFKAAAEINPLFEAEFALDIARRFNLDLGKRYKQLSFGMKAMANTLIALSSGKEIIVLDEPVLGFDPVMRKVFYELLQQSCTEKPKTVIISTHIIDEIEKVADHLIIIDHGTLTLFCGMDEIDEKAYNITGPAELVHSAAEGLRVLSETKAGGFISLAVYDRRIEEGKNYSLSALGLQDFFIALVGGKEII
jgi:ABC-2 type transport system ATP-binding protein